MFDIMPGWRLEDVGISCNDVLDKTADIACSFIRRDGMAIIGLID